ncbi:7-cyano-7-deazaguanine synthase QueC [Fibrobacterota bacterium]
MKSRKKNSSCLIVFSGGQDSTICLHWAKQNFSEVRAIFFRYGQRHGREEQAAIKIAGMNSIELKIFNLNFFKELGGNALIDRALEIEIRGGDLPNTFVPARNMLFLTCASSYAFTLGTNDLVTGVCQTDYSGYPDCRERTVIALENALSLGLDRSMRIHTPLMHLNKAGSVQLAIELDALGSLAHSHTCYEGHFPPCGTCPACKLRAKGFEQAGIPDPLLERLKQN